MISSFTDKVRNQPFVAILEIHNIQIWQWLFVSVVLNTDIWDFHTYLHRVLCETAFILCSQMKWVTNNKWWNTPNIHVHMNACGLTMIFLQLHLSEQNLFAYMNADKQNTSRGKLIYSIQTALSNCRMFYLLGYFDVLAFHPNTAKSSKVWNFWYENHFPMLSRCYLVDKKLLCL